MLMSYLGAQRDPAPALAWGLYFLFPFSQERALSCLAAAVSEFAEVMASQLALPKVLSDFPASLLYPANIYQILSVH